MAVIDIIPLKNIALVAAVVLTFGCAGALNSSEETNSDQTRDRNSPSEVFKNYWQYSKSGRTAEVASLLASPPRRLYFCTLMSRLECDNELEKANDRIEKLKGDKNFKELSVTHDDSMIRVNSPRAIRNGVWKSYSIENEQIINDEARLSVRLNLPGPYYRDFLFVKSAAGWKIIDVVDPGDHGHWASP